jgi:hypothetical protein
MSDLDRILSSMQIEIRELKSRMSILTRDLNIKTFSNIASSARKIPICGETYYIDSNGDVYFRNIYGNKIIGTHFRLNEINGSCVVEYSKDGGITPWVSAFTIVENPGDEE